MRLISDWDLPQWVSEPGLLTLVLWLAVFAVIMVLGLTGVIHLRVV